MIIHKEKLCKAIQIAQAVSSPRATLPCLQNIFLTPQKDGLQIHSTDLDSYICLFVPSSTPGQEDEGFSLPPASLNFLTQFPSEAITLRVEKDTLKIYIPDTEYGPGFHWETTRDKRSNAEKVPLPEPGADDLQTATYSPKDIQLITQVCARTASHDESRYALCGIRLEAARKFSMFTKKEHVAISTDARRLTLCTLSPQPSGGITATIPNKSIEVLTKILDSGLFSSGCHAAKSGQILQLQFEEEGVKLTLVSKLIEGNFPNWEQVIPHEKKESFITSLAPLQEILKVIAPCGDTIDIVLKDEVLRMGTCQRSEKLQEKPNPIAWGSTKLPGVKTPWQATLHKEYVRDILHTFTEATTITLHRDTDPIEFQNEERSIYHLLMPIRHFSNQDHWMQNFLQSL